MNKPGSNTPPSFFLAFFRWFCHPGIVEDIEGDLLERFERRVPLKGQRAARKLFIKDVLMLFRPGIIRSFRRNQKLNSYGMFKHNLLISYRSFLRNKSAFFTNLIGLSSGIACTLLIYLWVQDERGKDKFHELDNQLYQVLSNQEVSGSFNTTEESPGLLAEALVEEFPEVIQGIQTAPAVWFDKMLLTIEDKSLKASGQFAQDGYFEIFSFDLLEGQKNKILEDVSSIVISESLANRLFGRSENVVGETIKWQLITYERDLKISGVFKDLPEASTESFDFILPFKIFADIVGGGVNWRNQNAYTYVIVQPNTDIDLLNRKISTFVKDKLPTSNVVPFMRKYSDKYLFGNYENGIQAGGRIQYVKLFSMIAVFILLIACINFMNLATAKASKKTREIGVKKAIGATRGNLIIQYLEESLLMTFISVVVAIGLVYVSLPFFNSITGKSIEPVITAQVVLGILMILVVTGLLSGSYPALYLSGFKPTAIFKGLAKSSMGELWARKGLVVFQFVLSIILIVGVTVIYRQIEFLQNKSLGYDKENLVVFPNDGQITPNLTTFLNRVRETPGVLDASATQHTIVNGGSYTFSLNWEGKNPDVKVRFGNMTSYERFIETLGFEIVQGRAFDKELSSDEDKIIFNETAIKVMGMEDPIGKTIKLWGEDRQIIGVVKDFHFSSLHDAVGPLFLKQWDQDLTSIVVRLAPGPQRETLVRLESLYNEFNPQLDFDFQFLDQSYERQYRAEQRVSLLSRYFAGIAIIISCLGLLGLANFTTERRKKEISIRKVLGAGNASIVSLLSKDFNILIGMSIIIGLPISYYLVSNWLDDFAYKIDLTIWHFLGAGIMALVITWLTVGLQTLKAARANPARSLRNE